MELYDTQLFNIKWAYNFYVLDQILLLPNILKFKYRPEQQGTIALQQEGPGFESWPEDFWKEFPCSTCACVGSFQAL